jgi:hypothetical protein
VKSTIRIGFLPGITSSVRRNPSKKWDSAGNNQLMGADSDRKDQNPQNGSNFRISKYNSYLIQRSTFLKI